MDSMTEFRIGISLPGGESIQPSNVSTDAERDSFGGPCPELPVDMLDGTRRALVVVGTPNLRKYKRCCLHLFDSTS